MPIVAVEIIERWATSIQQGTDQDTPWSSLRKHRIWCWRVLCDQVLKSWPTLCSTGPNMRNRRFDSYAATISTLHCLCLLFAPSFIVQFGHPLMCTYISVPALFVTILCSDHYQLSKSLFLIFGPVEQRFGHRIWWLRNNPRWAAQSSHCIQWKYAHYRLKPILPKQTTCKKRRAVWHRPKIMLTVNNNSSLL